MNLVQKLILPLAAVGLLSATTIQGQEKHFFEANSWKDVYGDNNIYYPEGYSGIKHDFKENEEIIFVGHDPDWTPNDTIRWILYGPRGSIVEQDSFSPQSNGEWYHAGESWDEDLMNDLVSSSQGGEGNYRVIWYANGQEDGEDFFSVSK